MTLVRYKCDTCGREIEKQQNKLGLDVVGKCIITNNCKGRLSLQKTVRGHLVPSTTPAVSGVEDWIQRSVLYTHTQSTLNEEWVIEHNLGTIPTVTVYADQSVGEDQVRVEPVSVTFPDQNTVILIMDQSYSGTAQFVSNNDKSIETVIQKFTEEVSTNTATQLSVSGVTTIVTTNPSINLLVDVVYIDANTNQEIIVEDVNFSSSVTSAWSTVNSISLKGRTYYPISENLISQFLISSLNISNNSPFYLSNIRIGGVPYDLSSLSGSIFAVLTDPPYADQDRNLSILIDISSFSKDNAQNGLNYTLDAEVITDQSLNIEIFPQMILQ